MREDRMIFMGINLPQLDSPFKILNMKFRLSFKKIVNHLLSERLGVRMI